ncbi:hypothetical protein [Kineosporia babensis]|uniref:Uncharacterized protein n=1 Tax=Kineosporia babensis TaxID=499548 RepID=A0A9X1T3R5_9ACTN|nr:hypothetical protein [Kineosporia babensis]MCD5316003.1 hypothetical protein [Kineosporia babensis]
MLQLRTRRIVLVTAVTAALTAGGAGLAFAYPDGSPAPVESGYMVIEEPNPATDAVAECPEKGAGQAVLTTGKAQL